MAQLAVIAQPGNRPLSLIERKLPLEVLAHHVFSFFIDWTKTSRVEVKAQRRDVLACGATSRYFRAAALLVALRFDDTFQTCSTQDGSDLVTKYLPWKVTGLWIAGSLVLTDVDALGTYHTLTISSCYGITSVDALGTCHTLTIHYCPGVTSVDALGTCHTLTISRCKHLADIKRVDGDRL